ncbi:hypothetical protein FVE85_3082 [Porphyridium purpureum]|uniref:Transmembrane protein n=1 Tax=Porphyridium purpureum TaxID=35688 RepID=A0A5J4YTK0_PORPP|nr:hypothetical protein FVE85_3082 [Porphyridium purpureum]|eukprot:POR5302..scf227_4
MSQCDGKGEMDTSTPVDHQTEAWEHDDSQADGVVQVFVNRPALLLTGVVPIGLGMLVGIPLALKIGTSAMRESAGAEALKRHQPLPHQRVKTEQLYKDGAKLAAKALVYGTLLCAAFGVVIVGGIRWYYDVDSVRAFVLRMRVEVPQQQQALRGILERPLVALRGAGDGTHHGVEGIVHSVWTDSALARRVSERIHASSERRAELERERESKVPEGKLTIEHDEIPETGEKGTL